VRRGKERGYKMEKSEKGKIGIEKGKWGSRDLSELVLRQNREESQVTVR
jgi:hypothetical protein